LINKQIIAQQNSIRHSCHEYFSILYESNWGIKTKESAELLANILNFTKSSLKLIEEERGNEKERKK
jgi:hypothetical protein